MEATTPRPSVDTGAAAPEVRRVPMSYEAYLQYDEGAARTEWADGKVLVYMPPKAEHQRLVAFLERILALFVDLKGLGRVNIAPFEVKLWEDGPSREPDIFFVAEDSLGKLGPERFSGAPELVIEVISPGSLRIDRSEKFREYEQAGVREYWVVDSRPEQRRADFFRLSEGGRYDLFATETDETVSSEAVQGFWLHPEWLWKPDLNPLMLLADIVGQDTLLKALQNDERAE